MRYTSPNSFPANQLGPQTQRNDEKETISTEKSLEKEKKLSFDLTWQSKVADSLRELLDQKLKKNGKDDLPLLVSLVGIPGSGKSTSCKMLKDILSDVGFMILPFDGYHYPLDFLKAQPNSEKMIYRRGAPDTFDAKSLKRDLERIKNGTEPIISVPGFDHDKADPEHGAHIFVRSSIKIVLCEGLYLLHDDDGFEDVKALFDSSIYLDADVDECLSRLKVRNRCIPGYSPEEVDIRCEEVDRVNAMTVEKSKKNAEFVVRAFAA